jgi:hypothetical protein
LTLIATSLQQPRERMANQSCMAEAKRRYNIRQRRDYNISREMGSATHMRASLGCQL